MPVSVVVPESAIVTGANGSFIKVDVDSRVTKFFWNRFAGDWIEMTTTSGYSTFPRNRGNFSDHIDTPVWVDGFASVSCRTSGKSRVTDVDFIIFLS